MGKQRAKAEKMNQMGLGFDYDSDDDDDDGDKTESESDSDQEMVYDGSSVQTTKADIVGSVRSEKSGAPQMIRTNGGRNLNAKRRKRSDSLSMRESSSSDSDIGGSIDPLTGIKHSANYNKALAEQRKKGQYDPLLN